MRKTIFTLICLSAQAVYANHHPFTGLYLTGAVGAMNSRSDVTQNANSDFMGVIIDIPNQYDLNSNSAQGMIGIGYSYQFENKFVLGLSLNADYMNASASNTSTFNFVNNKPDILFTSNLETKLSNDFAILFKPGYVFGKSTQLYGLIGPRFGNFQTSTNIEFLAEVNGMEVIDSVNSDSTFGYEVGLTAGLGIQQHISERLHLGLEYAFTTYGNITAPDASMPIIFGEPAGYLTDNPDINVNTNAVLLGLTYQW